MHEETHGSYRQLPDKGLQAHGAAAHAAVAIMIATDQGFLMRRHALMR